MNTITGYKYQCLRCGALGNSIRCSVCGGDTEPTNPALIDADCGDMRCVESCFGSCGRNTYTIFDHAQGIKPGRRDAVSQEKL